jgi:hypothetical protein
MPYIYGTPSSSHQIPPALGDLEVRIESRYGSVPYRDANPRERRDFLTESCAKGNIKIVEKILTDPEIDVNGTPYNTPLMEACRYDRPEIVALLLTHPKIDVNKSDHGEIPPVWFSYANNQTKIFEQLIKRHDTNLNRYPDCTVHPLLLAAAPHVKRDDLTQLVLSQINLAPIKEPRFSYYNSDPYKSLYLSEYERLNSIIKERNSRSILFPAVLELARRFTKLGLLTVRQSSETDEEVNTKRTNLQRFFELASKLPPELTLAIAAIACGERKTPSDKYMRKMVRPILGFFE